MPGPAEIVLPLEYRDVVDAQALEGDGGTHTTEAGADDQHLVSRRVVCRLHERPQ